MVIRCRDSISHLSHFDSSNTEGLSLSLEATVFVRLLVYLTDIVER